MVARRALARRCPRRGGELGARLDDPRWDRVGDGVHPGVADFGNIAAHAHRIDARRSRQRAEQYRGIVLSAFRIDDVGEQKCLAIGLRQAAEELQPDERLQLAVLVDRAVDAHDETGLFQLRQMLLQILRRTDGAFQAVRVDVLVRHEASCGMRYLVPLPNPLSSDAAVCKMRFHRASRYDGGASW